MKGRRYGLRLTIRKPDKTSLSKTIVFCGILLENLRNLEDEQLFSANYIPESLYKISIKVLPKKA